MKNRGIRLLSFAYLVLALAACQGGTTPSASTTSETPASSVSTPSSSSTTEGPSLPVAENFDLGTAIADQSSWSGATEKNPVFDTANHFITFREKSNNAITYSKKGMSVGVIEAKLKVSISSDTQAYLSFSNQSADLKDFCYAKTAKMYTIEFSSDGKVYAKKWVGGVETALSGTKASSSIPLSLAAKLTSLKVSVSENSGSVSIKATSGATTLVDVTDSSSPILGGGAVGFAYTGLGGMALGAGDSDESKYVAPDPLGLTIYDSPKVALASGTTNLLDSFDTAWVGRERIFNVSKDATGYVFASKDNPEEPQGGVTEYQGLYKNKIFKDSQFTYTYNQLANGEWTMFWLRCVPESSTNVSIWGNKKTGENTNGYSMLITFDGYVQVHKWSDGAEIWLNGQGTKLPGATSALMNDPAKTITLKNSIEEITLAGKSVIEIRIQVNDAPVVVVQDSDTPFVNPGYVGLQGYATNNKTDSIRLLTASASDQLSL